MTSRGTINGIPRVDPHFRSSARRMTTLLSALFGARPLAAAWRKIGAPLEIRVIAATDGRVRLTPGSLVLTTVGARTGQRRETALSYFTDGDDVILMASNYGGKHHPGWYYNLVAHPQCELHIGPRGGRFVARRTDGQDRDRLFTLSGEFFPAARKYARRVDGIRTIPMLRLTPSG